MKQLLYLTTTTILGIILLSSSIHPDYLCIKLDKLKVFPNVRLTFTPKVYSNFNTKNIPPADKPLYELLMQRDMLSSDKMFLIGKFPIMANRIGLICYNETIECDNKINFISLHIIDSCKKVADTKFISSDDSNPFIYSWSSELSPRKDTLIMTLNQTSEWAMEMDSDVDTLFTEKYYFNLKSNNLDTIAVVKTFKPFTYGKK